MPAVGGTAAQFGSWARACHPSSRRLPIARDAEGVGVVPTVDTVIAVMETVRDLAQLVGRRRVVRVMVEMEDHARRLAAVLLLDGHRLTGEFRQAMFPCWIGG